MKSFKVTKNAMTVTARAVMGVDRLVSLNGDGLSQGDEECDDSGESEGCNADCSLAICGDAILNRSRQEQCDDGKRISGDGCSSACQLEATCGDGFSESPEECDDGNLINDDECTNSCRLPVCGDEILQANEGCDDGNLISGDARMKAVFLKSAAMEFQAGEQCDDQNAINGDGCDNLCRIELCGNGVLQALEGCDDGNLILEMAVMTSAVSKVVEMVF